MSTKEKLELAHVRLKAAAQAFDAALYDYSYAAKADYHIYCKRRATVLRGDWHKLACDLLREGE